MQTIITDILKYMEGLPVGVKGNGMGRVVGPVAERDESVRFGEYQELRYVQTGATLPCNNSQHYWVLHVASV